MLRWVDKLLHAFDILGGECLNLVLSAYVHAKSSLQRPSRPGRSSSSTPLVIAAAAPHLSPLPSSQSPSCAVATSPISTTSSRDREHQWRPAFPRDRKPNQFGPHSSRAFAISFCHGFLHSSHLPENQAFFAISLRRASWPHLPVLQPHLILDIQLSSNTAFTKCPPSLSLLFPTISRYLGIVSFRYPMICLCRFVLSHYRELQPQCSNDHVEPRRRQ